MGALHDGHLALVDAAKGRSAAVAASVFVNPLQFAPSEDLERYPRDLERDRKLLAEKRVDVLFAPAKDDMYPANFSTQIDVGALGKSYEGAVRPTHFNGVATVVAKLLHIVQPEVLYIGQKDAQQTAVLRKLVRDLAFPIDVQIVPTVREADGVALSSRNVYLTEQQRASAPSLSAALEVLAAHLREGASKSAGIAAARARLDPAAQWDYLDVVDAETFEPIEALRPPAFVIGAARFGRTRLLDNLWIQ